MFIAYVSTISQTVYRTSKIKKSPHSRTFKLHNQPQILTTCWRVLVRSPKKPNSGKRRVAKVRIKHVKFKDRLTCKINSYLYVPRKYGRVLVRGGRANDVPGITYSGIRGVYDFPPHNRKKKRSLYAAWKPIEKVTHIAKKYRALGISKPEDIASGRRSRKS